MLSVYFFYIPIFKWWLNLMVVLGTYTHSFIRNICLLIFHLWYNLINSYITCTMYYDQCMNYAKQLHINEGNIADKR